MIKTTLSSFILGWAENVPSRTQHEIALAVVTFVAFLARFIGLDHPSQVVFDESHTIRVCLSPRRRKWLREDDELTHLPVHF